MTLAPTPPTEVKAAVAKSLGEKLFDAFNAESKGAPLVWATRPERNRDYYECVALHFAVSMSHDETSAAVTAALTERATKAEAERDEARAERDAMAEGLKAITDLYGVNHTSKWCRDFAKTCASALLSRSAQGGEHG